MSKRDSLINGTCADIVTYQVTTTNNISSTNPLISQAVSISNSILELKEWLQGNNIDLVCLIQHNTKAQLSSNNYNTSNDCIKYVISQIRKNNIPMIGYLGAIFKRIHDTYESGTYLEFVSKLSNDDVHLNTDGLSVYKAMFESLYD